MMQSWRLANPNWEIRFYDDEACLEFVQHEFPEYLEAYRQGLTPCLASPLAAPLPQVDAGELPQLCINLVIHCQHCSKHVHA